MVDIILSDSTGPNSRSLKGSLLFRSDWIEVIGKPPFWKFIKV